MVVLLFPGGGVAWQHGMGWAGMGVRAVLISAMFFLFFPICVGVYDVWSGWHPLSVRRGQECDGGEEGVGKGDRGECLMIGVV